MTTTFRHHDTDHAIDILGRSPLRLQLGPARHEVRELSTFVPSGDLELEIDGTRHHAQRFVTSDRIWIRVGGRTFVFERSEAGGGARGGAAKNEVRADMPGTVVAVHVTAGQSVTAGEPLVTIESMKLQISVTADRDAVVGAVPVTPDTTFDRGAVLVVFAETP